MNETPDNPMGEHSDFEIEIPEKIQRKTRIQILTQLQKRQELTPESQAQLEKDLAEESRSPALFESLWAELGLSPKLRKFLAGEGELSSELAKELSLVSVRTGENGRDPNWTWLFCAVCLRAAQERDFRFFARLGKAIKNQEELAEILKRRDSINIFLLKFWTKSPPGEGQPLYKQPNTELLELINRTLHRALTLDALEKRIQRLGLRAAKKKPYDAKKAEKKRIANKKQKR